MIITGSLLTNLIIAVVAGLMSYIIWPLAKNEGKKVNYQGRK
ncbi:hypothetical protein [Ruminiclostridium josui]|nr:hypothetical protein [Ruminiclostridium josui]